MLRRSGGWGGGTGKGEAFDSLPPTTRLPAEPALLNLTCNFNFKEFLGGDVRLGHWNP